MMRLSELDQESWERVIDENDDIIDVSMQLAARHALRENKRLGIPTVVWKDGKVQWIQPEDIDVPEDDSDLLNALPTNGTHSETK
jgi:hypothetical protein